MSCDFLFSNLNDQIKIFRNPRFLLQLKRERKKKYEDKKRIYRGRLLSLVVRFLVKSEKLSFTAHTHL